MGMFAKENTVDIDVGDGFTVTVYERATAGVQEDIEAYQTKMRQMDDGNHEFVVHTSKLLFVRLMITKITYPDGHSQLGPISEADARKFDRHAFAKVLNVVEANNPPFNFVRVQAEADNLSLNLSADSKVDPEELAVVLASAMTKMEEGWTAEEAAALAVDEL